MANSTTPVWSQAGLLPVARDVSIVPAEHLERGEICEQAQSVVEEYESALEELKSANEELVSINEDCD